MDKLIIPGAAESGKISRPLHAKVLLQAALSYHDRGWTVFPLWRKKPLAGLCWSLFRRQRPNEQQICRWFHSYSYHEIDGIGIIPGEPSLWIAVRDFDDPQAYNNWTAAYPDWARVLPTVRTGRGYHVYFRAPKSAYHKLADGELIANQFHYFVAPPSRHPSKCFYRWIVPLPPVGQSIPTILPSDVGLVPPHASSHTPAATRDTGPVKSPVQASKKRRKPLPYTSVLHSAELPGDPVLQTVVSRAVPSGPGQRHHSLQALVRALDGAGLGQEHLQAAFDVWYASAVSAVRTKDYAFSWDMLVELWELSQERREQGKAEGSLDGIIDVAKTIAVPEKYQLPPSVREVYQLSAAMAQRHQGKPFFLSCHLAAELIGMDHHSTAYRAQMRLKKDGVIVREKVGDHWPGGEASVWKWIGVNE